jgi:hypothetical protein
VRARQNADFAENGADCVIETATVEPLALLHDQGADVFLLDVIERVLEDVSVTFSAPNFSTSFLPISSVTA